MTEQTQDLANYGLALAAWNSGKDIDEAIRDILGGQWGRDHKVDVSIAQAMKHAILDALRASGDFECDGAYSSGNYSECGVADIEGDDVYWWDNNAETSWTVDKPDWWDEQLAAMRTATD